MRGGRAGAEWGHLQREERGKKEKELELPAGVAERSHREVGREGRRQGGGVEVVSTVQLMVGEDAVSLKSKIDQLDKGDVTKALQESGLGNASVSSISVQEVHVLVAPSPPRRPSPSPSGFLRLFTALQRARPHLCVCARIL